MELLIPPRRRRERRQASATRPTLFGALQLLILFLGACASVGARPERADLGGQRVYEATPVHLTLKALEAIESMPGWRITGLVPEQGVIRATQPGSWITPERSLLARITPEAGSLRSEVSVEVTGEEAWWSFGEETQPAREFLRALDERWEVP